MSAGELEVCVDAEGRPLEYRVLHPTLPNIPLNESRVWPEWDTDTDRRARFFAGLVEQDITKDLGLVACPADMPHGHGRNREHPFADSCPSCGAAL